MRHAISILLIVTAAVAAAQAQDKPKIDPKGDKERAKASARARKELEATFARRSKFVKNIDADGMVSQVSPDYSATLPDGRTMNYADLVVYIRNGGKQFVSVSEASITIESFSLNGNEATVDARQKILRKQRLADGQVHDVETGVLQREIWVKTPNGWKLKGVDNLRDRKVLVDGQPYGSQ